MKRVMGLIIMGVMVITPALSAPQVAATTRLPWCGVGVLRATIGAQEGGAGSVFTTLVFRNVGRVSCVLRGYAGVSLVDGRGRQIGRPARRVPAPAAWIMLRPGATASTVVHTLNPGTGTTDCLPPSAALRVYPPDSYTSLIVRVRLSECLGSLDIRPLVAG